MADSRQKFGLLVYYGTGNLGDEIQSLAARRFLPRVNYFFNRDSLGTTAVKEGESVKVILNGWFFKKGSQWPPPRHIEPLITSFHIDQGARQSILSTSGVDYLKQHEPIGARDLFTLDLLRKAGLKAFFSGCLTLTLERPQVARSEDLIVTNHVAEPIVRLIASRTGKRIVATSHSDCHKTHPDARLIEAQRLLDIYAEASCVVTSRLHCALPCLAFGTPVLLLDYPFAKQRFAGLKDFCWYATENRLLNNDFDYNFDAPPANPDLFDPYRELLIENVSSFASENENHFRGGRFSQNAFC